MAIYKYGTQEVIPESYRPIREILAGMGYGPDQVSWNPQTKNPVVAGMELDASKLLFGSDQRYYATPETVTTMLTQLGLPTQRQTFSVPQYQSPYEQQIADALKQYQQYVSTGFQWDPSSDPGFQQAQKYIQEKIMLDFARRGMLYSPATGQAIAEGIASAMPQYEQAAYQRWLSEGERLMNMFNVLMSLDERSFNLYRDAVENEYREWERLRTERLDQLDAMYKRIDYAFRKLDELEEADNEVAAILGIPVGTKSQRAKERAEELKNRIELMRLEEEQRMRQEQRALANEKALIQYRASLEKQKEEASSIENLGTPQQVDAYYEFLRIYTGQSYNKKYLNNPYAAYQQIIAKRKEHIELLGEKLYRQLLSDIMNMMETQRTYGREEQAYGPQNYKDNPLFHQEMNDAMSNPESWLKIFNEYSDLYYQTYGIGGVNELVKAAEGQLEKGKSKSQSEKYSEYYRMAVSDPKQFKKMMNDNKQRAKILEEVGIEYYEKLVELAQRD